MKLGRFLLIMAGLIAVALFCLLMVHFLIMPRIVHRHEVVRTPELLGDSVAEARTEAELSNLAIEVVRRDSHPSLPAGTVIDQLPRSGMSVREGRRIAVVVSNGPPAGSVPSLGGLSPRQAGTTLQRESYLLGRTLRVRRQGTAAPVVAWQSPPAGTHLRKGRRVDMVVAEPVAAEAYLMPELRGLSLFVARESVEHAGCVTAAVRYRREKGLAPNTVLEQTPAPGSRIRKGETVELVASTR